MSYFVFARNLLGAGHARTNVEIRMLNYMECLALIRSQARSNKQQGDVCEGGGATLYHRKHYS